MINQKHKVYSFYRFFNLNNKKRLKKDLDIFISKMTIRGTVLLADEGINGSLSGSKEDLDRIIKFIKKWANIRKLDIKINETDFLPFNRVKIRLKKEIVSLGIEKLNVAKSKRNYIEPKAWHKILSNKNIKLIDVRNIFEISIGKFNHAINPKTASFRDFPKSFEKLNLKKNDKIAIYCTGGIRCEKASVYMKQIGFKDIVQLKGGIINYLSYFKKRKNETLWKGECFVFDNRVTINKNLNRGKYLQCHGCRRPISYEDTKSSMFIRGVSCPYCFKIRTKEQKKRSLTRQKQIDFAEANMLDHSFKRI